MRERGLGEIRELRSCGCGLLGLSGVVECMYLDENDFGCEFICMRMRPGWIIMVRRGGCKSYVRIVVLSHGLGFESVDNSLRLVVMCCS